MIWIFLTLLISVIDLYVGYKINPSLDKGFRVFDPDDSDEIVFVVTFSLIPVLNVILLLRIIILGIANIYLNNYDY